MRKIIVKQLKTRRPWED